MKNLLIFLLSAGALAQAPVAPKPPVPQMANAFFICTEGCTITAMPIGTVYQFGTRGKFTPPVTTTASTALPLYAYYTVLGDPAEGLVKEFDVQQTTVPQTIVYTAQGSTTPVTVVVPALAPVNKPGATVSTVFTGNPLTCFEQKSTAKNPDGTDGKTYLIISCGPLD